MCGLLKRSSSATLLLIFFVLAPPAMLHAQANSVNYTKDYPPVERVKAEIKGKDPTDTLARQVAVFTYLSTQIKRIKENRDYRGPFTPDESRLIGAYDLAAYQMQQDYNKSHTPDEAKAFDVLQFNYVLDRDFRADWTKRLIGPQGQNAYNGALKDLAATQEKHYNQEMQTYVDAKKQQAAASSSSSPASTDPTAIATRRCLELGGNELACVGKGMFAGIMDLAGGSGLGSLTGPGSAKAVLSGLYSGSGNTLSFDTGSVVIGKCGDLVPDGHSYTLVKSPGMLQAKVDNASHPFALTMRPDGGLTGPGAVDVSGRIIIGYHTVVSTLYENGAPARCGVGICTTTTRVPDYAPKIERCTIASFNPPPPQDPSAAHSQSGGLLGGMTDFLGTFVPTPQPGLRMIGQYAGPGGLSLAFDTGSVTLDCGNSHVKQPYLVRNTPNQLVIDVQNSGSPFSLAIQPDNSLRGSGATTVKGRLVSGMQGNNVTYSPVSASCTVSTFAANTGNSAGSVGSAGSAPTAAGSNSASGAIVRISILSGFAQGPNPLPGKQVFLMKDRFDTVLKNGGFSVAANSSPGKALMDWTASCKSPTDACKAMLRTIGTDVVARTTLDGAGNGTIIEQLQPGTYFVMVSAPGAAGQALLWDLQTSIKAGNNSVVLDPRSAETIRSTP